MYVYSTKRPHRRWLLQVGGEGSQSKWPGICCTNGKLLGIGAILQGTSLFGSINRTNKYREKLLPMVHGCIKNGFGAKQTGSTMAPHHPKRCLYLPDIAGWWGRGIASFLCVRTAVKKQKAARSSHQTGYCANFATWVGKKIRAFSRPCYRWCYVGLVYGQWRSLNRRMVPY